MSSTGIATCLEADLEAEIIREIPNRSLPLRVIRRCRDLSEILATVRASLVDIILLDTDIIDLTSADVRELTTSGATVIALAPASELDYLTRIGSLITVAKDEEGQTASLVNRLLEAMMSQLLPPPPDTLAPAADSDVTDDSPGHVIVFWSAVGATGRSSLALNLASSLRNYGRVLIVDADTVESSLVQMLGVELESSGLLRACRLAGQGKLDVPGLSQLVTNVGLGVDLLTGLTKAERWREVNETDLATVLDCARQSYRWILVDVAPGADDPSDALTAMGTPRLAATTGAFSTADLVIEVGLADPIGIRRLTVNHLWAQSNQLWSAKSLAVVNRGRASVGGGNWKKSLSRVVSQTAPDLEVLTIREAVADFDAALIAGCDICTANPQAPVLQDFDAICAYLMRCFGMIPRRSTNRRRRRDKSH